MRFWRHFCKVLLQHFAKAFEYTLLRLLNASCCITPPHCKLLEKLYRFFSTGYFLCAIQINNVSLASCNMPCSPEAWTILKLRCSIFYEKNQSSMPFEPLLHARCVVDSCSFVPGCPCQSISNVIKSAL